MPPYGFAFFLSRINFSRPQSPTTISSPILSEDRFIFSLWSWVSHVLSFTITYSIFRSFISVLLLYVDWQPNILQDCEICVVLSSILSYYVDMISFWIEIVISPNQETTTHTHHSIFFLPAYQKFKTIDRSYYNQKSYYNFLFQVRATKSTNVIDPYLSLISNTFYLPGISSNHLMEISNNWL